MSAGQGIGEGPRTAVLISGGGTNLQAIIDAVTAGNLHIRLEAVISDRPDAFGLARAREAGIPAQVIDYASFGTRTDAEIELADALEKLNPELVVLAGFMRILPADLVERFPGRMLNIHPSLLPRHRGLDTYRRALEAGDDWHGSTVHFVTSELDAGPAIIQYRVPVHPDESEASLSERVRSGEYLIYPRAIGWIADGRVELEGDAIRFDGRILDGPEVVNET